MKARFARILTLLSLSIAFLDHAEAQVPQTGPSLNQIWSIWTMEYHAARYLTDGNFAALDSMIQKCQESHLSLRSGDPAVHFMYEGMRPSSRAFRGVRPEEVLDLLLAWKAASPDSISPRIGLAIAYTDLAWTAAKRPDMELTDVARARLDQARKELSGFHGPVRDPHYYLVWIEIHALEREDFWLDFEKGTELDPHYYYLYNYAAMYSCKKWDGSAAKVQRVAARGVDLTRGTMRNALLARVAWVVWLNSNTFFDYGFDWQSVQEGFKDWMSRYPESTRALHRLGMMAWTLKDRAVARTVFSRKDINWDTARSDRTEWTKPTFEQAREWALSDSSAAWLVADEHATEELLLAENPKAFESEPDDPRLQAATAALSTWVRPREARWPRLGFAATVRCESQESVSHAVYVENRPGGAAVALSITPEGFDPARCTWTIDGEPAKIARNDTSAGEGSRIGVLSTGRKGDATPLSRTSRIPEAGDKLYVAFLWQLDGRGSQRVVNACAVPSDGDEEEAGKVFEAALESMRHYPSLSGAPVLNENGELVGLVVDSEVLNGVTVVRCVMTSTSPS